MEHRLLLVPVLASKGASVGAGGKLTTGAHRSAPLRHGRDISAATTGNRPPARGDSMKKAAARRACSLVKESLGLDGTTSDGPG